MELDITEQSLPVYEALASKVRLNLLSLLADRPMNVRELAEASGLSSAIMTMHVRKLETAGLIRTERVAGRGGARKVCSLAEDRIEIILPKAGSDRRSVHPVNVPIGHFTDWEVHPTCGLATTEKMIGQFDDPRFFLSPERVNASILWFGQGFVEYRAPNFLLSSQTPEELEISMEISSEAPGVNEDWPSDITFHLNGVELGTWTSPGDYGERRGNLTPAWWPNDINQYGLLKRVKINKSGTFMDGTPLSSVTLDQISPSSKEWKFRIGVRSDAQHVGGMTLFGSGFGNYNQDILFRLYYRDASRIDPQA